MAAIFACIVQPKVIEFNVSDQKLHRAQKDEELRSELEALKLPSSDENQAEGSAAAGALLCHPGGGCRLLSRSTSVSLAAVGSVVCVFEGALANVGSLAEDYAPLPEDEPTPTPAALSTAELLCHLYAKVGVEMLGLLRGAFTFVLYESKTSRVLAARDGTGRCPLFQARNSAGSLVVSNSAELLDGSGCTDKLEFTPGDYKYGWSAVPRRYQPTDHARLSRRSLDLPGSVHHHHNNHNNNHNGQAAGGSRSGSRRTSLDHHEFPPAATAAPSSAQRGPHHNQQPQPQAVVGSPSETAQHPHPHRTYIVSAEDARILKTSPGPGQQRPQQAAEAAPAPAAAPSGTWTASSPAPGGAPGGRGNGKETGGNGAGRPGSGRHNRRRSMDTHGAWRLGAGEGVSAAAGSAAAGKQQQHGVADESQPQQAPPQAAPKQPGGPKQQQQHPVTPGGGKQQQQQQHPQGTPNGGRPRSSRDGRASLDGRGPGRLQHHKQQQQAPKPAAEANGGPARSEVAAAAAGAPRAAPSPPAPAPLPVPVAVLSTNLRVDAPEFVCTRTVRPAAVAVVPTAVVSAP